MNCVHLKFLFILLIHVLNQETNNVLAIGCFKCSSLNNDTYCKDPFSPGSSNISDKYYDADCRAGMESRTGLFPARYCLKVSGTLAGTSEQVVIRTCTIHKLLEADSSYSSFTLKLEDNKELVLNSGLIASCRDDGCNTMSLIKSKKKLFYFIYFICFFELINELF